MKDGLRILLISPQGEFLCRSEEFSRFMRESREIRTVLHYWNGIGAALPTIAALTPGEQELRIIDENFEEVNLEEDYDIVAVTAMTQQAVRAYALADAARARGAHVVLGGIHATVRPDEAQAHADTVIVGEAERSWPRFIEDYAAGRPAARYGHVGDEPVDLRTIPTPRYDLLANYHYPVLWIQTTRGCPHDCEFCSASRLFGWRYRHKDVDQVLAEVSEIRKHWRFAQIGFADDNMFVEKRHSRDLLDAFKTMRFTWLAQSDVSVAKDQRLLDSLRESGCRILFIGFESVDGRNLENINTNGWKAKMSRRYGDYIRRIQASGIGIYGSFILGLDRDTPETVERTIEFINDTCLMGAQITILTPFPGSRLATRLQAEGRIIHTDWQWYTAWNAVIRHPHFTPEELERSMLRIYRGIYNEESFVRRARHFKEICSNLID